MMNPIALNASVNKIIANDNLLWYRQGEGEHKGLAYVKLRHMAAIILADTCCVRVRVCVCVGVHEHKLVYEKKKTLHTFQRSRQIQFTWQPSVCVCL